MKILNKQLITTAGTAFMVLGIDTTTPDVTSGDRLVSTGSDILVQVMPSLAKFTSELHLFSPYRRYITTNRDTRGAINLGNFPVGSELIFGIFVRDTGNILMMGSGKSNPDGVPHASIQILRSGVVIVGFQDVWEEQNKSLDNSTMKSEIPILDIIEPFPESANAKSNLVFGNFNVSLGSKRQQQHKAV
jgi:hypothetical protein